MLLSLIFLAYSPAVVVGPEPEVIIIDPSDAPDEPEAAGPLRLPEVPEEPPDEPDMIVEGGGSPEVPEQEISPGETTIHYVYFEFVELGVETKYNWSHYLNLIPTAVGSYRVEIWIDLYNPSLKWMHKAFTAKFDAVPTDMVEKETMTWDWAPTRVILDRNLYVENAYVAVVEFEVLTVDGRIECRLLTNTLITDLNGDKIVDIFDVVKLAKEYLKEYKLYTIEDPLFKIDIEVDGRIDMMDVIIISLDFGLEIPDP